MPAPKTATSSLWKSASRASAKFINKGKQTYGKVYKSVWTDLIKSIHSYDAQATNEYTVWTGDSKSASTTNKGASNIHFDVEYNVAYSFPKDAGDNDSPNCVYSTPGLENRQNGHKRAN